jgi:Tol biopolymer transport system component/DNA-binding winged helix-turn-helix (wHTH) protein
VRFGVFEVDLQAGELRKSGVKLKLSGQPFQVLTILLNHPGEVVTREELQKRLWPDTFVDAEHNLNTAINKIREALSDSAESPRFVETLPRRGYRFIAPLNDSIPAVGDPKPAGATLAKNPFPTQAYLTIALAVLAIVAAYLLYRRSQRKGPIEERTLTRITFEKGLQLGATWSPDGRFIAYASNRAGKFDVWVQQLSGESPIQVTHQPGDNWQPDWSPDGRFLVYRSEESGGGLFVVPAMGGEGQERKISSFGSYPQWSPDGSRILFQATHFASINSFYVVGLNGEAPQPVLSDFFATHKLDAVSAAWHPDGTRISVSIWNATPIPEFWTVVIGSAEGVKTEIDPFVSAQLADASANYPIGVELIDFKFRWAFAGDAIYFERTFRGVKNLWKMTTDRTTLRGTRIARLTTGAGADTELALSPDGTKLAFTTEAVHVAAWLFPFNATAGRVTGTGVAISAPGSATGAHAMTTDGSKIALMTERNGRLELWEKSLVRDHEVPVLVDDHAPRAPAWSPNGQQLAYYREKSRPGESEISVWSSDTRTDQALTSPGTMWRMPVDWSPDGHELLIAQATQLGTRWELWSLPASRTTETVARKIAADPRYDLYQPHFSPNGQWIVFEAVGPAAESVLYVVPAKGGPWVPIPALGHWDDKPRWSPDGKLIYYLSERQGFFNVWGLHFDKDRGVPVGQPFRVTNFQSPNLMIPTYIPPVELSITKDKLVVNLAEVTGSIWMLDHVGP